ncbi:MAG: extracellular solute-binding protein [Candidatus Thermoplasmatota archaeon]|nr:extracellular solute-binding protein [Candidatus Thermoplasmatota archaeon]
MESQKKESQNLPGSKLGGPKKGIIVAVVLILIAAGGLGGYEFYKSSASGVTITVWGAGSAGGEQSAFNHSLASFEQAYPNITVQDSPAATLGNLPTVAHAGTAPNVVRLSSDQAGLFYSAGLVLNMSKYLNKSFTSQYTKGTIADWTSGGTLYGIPVNTNGIGLYYNKQLVPTPPTNTYQMIMDAKNVSDMGSSYVGLPYALGADYGYRFAAWLPAFNGELFNSSFYPMLNSTNDTAALSFVWNWTVHYKIDKPGLSTVADEQALFESGKAAFILDGPWDQSTYQNALGKNLGVTAIPFDNATGKWPMPLWGSQGYAITVPQASGATSAQTWASVQFIKWMTNYSSQLALFNKAGDFPSLNSVGAYISVHNNSDPLISGWVAQEQHTQFFPNYPQMGYYWSAFHAGATDLAQNSTTVSVSDATKMIEASIIQSLQSNNLPYSSPAMNYLYGAESISIGHFVNEITLDQTYVFAPFQSDVSNAGSGGYRA